MAGALNQTLTCHGNTHIITTSDVIKCVIISFITVLVIVANVFCLVVFNSRKSRKHFTDRVRYAMTSLCCTDLSIGFLVCPSTIYPALKHCWPFGEITCKFEALLISALFHQSTLNMVLIAIDRYCIVHHPSYHVIMTSQKFLLVIVATWIVVFSTYTVVIFVGEQFYFDEIGVNCEPFYQNPDVTLSVLSIFYFTPAIIFVFCYGSIYRTATKRKQFLKTCSSAVAKLTQKRLHANIRTSKYLAAITAGFFCAVTPWTLTTLAIVAFDVTLPDDVDFSVTWLALSNSFWNCVIYCLLNRKFRLAAMKFACGRWVKSIRNKFAASKTGDDVSRVMCHETIGNNRMNYINNEAFGITHTGIYSVSATPLQTPVTSPNPSPLTVTSRNSSPKPVSSQNPSPKALTSRNPSPRPFTSHNPSPKALTSQSPSPKSLTSRNPSPQQVGVANGDCKSPYYSETHM